MSSISTLVLRYMNGRANANPLEDIRNTTKISGVVVNGRFLGRQELDNILAEVEATANRK